MCPAEHYGFVPAGNAHDRARLPLAELPGGAAAWAALKPAECHVHPSGCPGWGLLRELRAWAAARLGLRCACRSLRPRLPPRCQLRACQCPPNPPLVLPGSRALLKLTSAHVLRGEVSCVTHRRRNCPPCRAAGCGQQCNSSWRDLDCCQGGFATYVPACCRFAKDYRVLPLLPGICSIWRSRGRLSAGQASCSPSRHIRPPAKVNRNPAIVHTAAPGT